MNISAFRFFVEVARSGSVRQAAGQLHITASALSRQLANLEHALGAQLFERRPTGMVLTAEGKQFLIHAKRTLNELDLARAEIQEIKGLRRGTIKLYTVEGIVGSYLFPVIAEFKARYPGINLEVTVAGGDDVIEALENDEAEIGVGFHNRPSEEIRNSLEIFTPLVAVVAPGHVLSGRASLSMGDLVDQRLCILDTTFGTRHLVDEAAKKTRVEISFDLSINSIEMLKIFVERHEALTILPIFSVTKECAEGRLVAIPMTEKIFTRASVTICTHSSREISTAAKVFIEHLNERLKTLET